MRPFRSGAIHDVAPVRRCHSGDGFKNRSVGKNEVSYVLFLKNPIFAAADLHFQTGQIEPKYLHSMSSLVRNKPAGPVGSQAAVRLITKLSATLILPCRDSAKTTSYPSVKTPGFQKILDSVLQGNCARRQSTGTG